MRTKRLTKNRWMIWLAIALAIVSGGIGYSAYNKLQTSKNIATPPAATTVSQGDIVLIATGPGTLIPSEEVSFGFKNSGQVKEVLVKLGDTVKIGQVLARLEGTTLDLEYKQAEANLAALASPSGIAVAMQTIEDAKTSLAVAKDNLQHLIGPDMLSAEDNVTNAQQKVQLAQVMVVKDPSAENKQKVAAAETALAKAEGILTSVEFNYASNYTLKTFTYPVRNSNGVTINRDLFAPSDTEISSARAAYELAKADFSDAQNYLDVLNGVKTVDQVPASSVTKITEAQTALDQAKANLDATELIAAINGTITSINLNVGEDAGTSAVITISNTTQPYMIDVYLDETDWDKANIGYDATVVFDMLPNNSYPGKVVEVYPVLDSSSGTSLVHILVKLNTNLKTDLPAGATASVDVTGGKALGVVLVPVSAIKELEPGKYVVYLITNSKPEEQAVEIGLQDIVNAEVRSGLKPGEVVLTNAEGNH